MKLYFDYAWQPAVRDRRSVHVKRVIAGIQKEDFPKYLAFEFVPNSAPSNVVRFKKWNHDRAQLLPIAEINWGSGDATGTITTLETNSSVPIKQLRTPKKESSRSRRFVVDGQTYKWKIMPNGTDLRCFTDGGLRSDCIVAEWKDAEKTMWADTMSDRLREQVVLSLYLNLYYISIGQW